MQRTIITTMLLISTLLPRLSSAQDLVNTDSLLSIWNNTKKHDTTRLSSLKLALRGYYLSVDLDSAKILSKEMLKFAEKKKNNRYQGIAYNFLGEIEARSGGDLETSITIFKKGLKLARKTDDLVLISGCLNNIGLINEWLGNFSEAIEYYNRSLKVNMADSVRNAKYIAKTTMNVGDIFYQFEQFDKALTYYKQAERSLKLTPDDNTGDKDITLASVWASIGDALMKTDRADDAMPYFKNGKKLFEKWGDEAMLATSYQGIADVHRSLGRVNESLPYYLKALEIVEKYEGPDGIAGMLTNLAAAYLDLNDYENAKIAGLRAMSMMDEVQITDPKVAAMRIMIEVYKHEKDYKAATEMLEKLSDFRQELVNERVTDEVLKSEMKYGLEKNAYKDSLETVRKNERIARKHEADLADKEQQKITAYWIGGGVLLIALFLAFSYYQKRKRNHELNEKNRIIEGALDEKAVLLKEISHRVKNNMQMISGLLHLKARNTDNPKVKEALMDSRSRVDSMGLIHQKMYQSDIYDSIDISEYTRDIVRVLINCAPNPDYFDYRVEGKDVMMSLEKGQAIAFVVHELITNSLKHAWEPDDKDRQIDLTYVNQEGFIELHYQDNGKGLPTDTDLSKSESLGLKLLHSFATRQLRGSIKHSTGKLGGAYFVIIIRRQSDRK